MKTILVLLPFLFSGCCNMPGLVRALAKDPATVGISIQTVYGTAYFVRTVNTNQEIIVGPITVK